MVKPRQILFVSSELPDEFTHRALEGGGFTVALAPEGEPAYRKLLESRFDLVVVSLGQSTGVDFIKRVRETERTKALLVLALGEWGTGRPSLALSQGADAYEPAPIDAKRLITSIERLLGDRAEAASPKA
jgi:DNA-binding response OmpR family regulator